MEFPTLGEHCSHSTCHRLDFLPMKCDACFQNFCNDHFRYDNHGCDGERKKDVQVPTCPLCEAPVPGKRGEAPDIAVSMHIDNDCQADPAKKRRNEVYTNRCSFKGCKIKEMVPVVCNECSLNFCFRHRHCSDHNCEGKVSALRKKAASAAMTRMKERETTSKKLNENINRNNSTSNIFTTVQGNMSEDEALAHALALSMQDETNSSRNVSNQQNRSLNQNLFNRQHVGGESNSGRCIVS